MRLSDMDTLYFRDDTYSVEELRDLSAHVYDTAGTNNVSMTIGEYLSHEVRDYQAFLNRMSRENFSCYLILFVIPYDHLPLKINAGSEEAQACAAWRLKLGR